MDTTILKWFNIIVFAVLFFLIYSASLAQATKETSGVYIFFVSAGAAAIIPLILTVGFYLKRIEKQYFKF